MSRGPITSHILNIARGKPAAGVRITLAKHDEAGPSAALTEIASRVTDPDGRVIDLLPPGPAPLGTYRLTFDVKSYFEALGEKAFYPSVSVDFVIEAEAEHYHVPLLLSPFGYSTYRGS